MLGSLGDISKNISPEYVDFKLLFKFFNVMAGGTYTKHCDLEIQLETAPEQKARLPRSTRSNRASLRDGKKRADQEELKNNISQNSDHSNDLVALGPCVIQKEAWLSASY